jgi:hypothetical protein
VEPRVGLEGRREEDVFVELMEREEGLRGRPIRERAAVFPKEILEPLADGGAGLAEESAGEEGEVAEGEETTEACAFAAFQAASFARLAACFSSSVCGVAGLEPVEEGWGRCRWAEERKLSSTASVRRPVLKEGQG